MQKVKLYNNLSANLVQRLIISVGGETIYDNSWENLLRTYSDLWLSQRAREELTEFGVCTEPLRNVNEKSCKVTRTLANLFRHQKIPLGKIISDQGMMLPSCMHHNLSFTLVLTDATCVLNKGSYTLTSLEVEYDVVASPSLRTLIHKQYDIGKSLPFRGVSWLHQTVWGKDQMLVNETINVSKKCLNQIILLFTKKSGRNGSEEFVFPGISEVNVTVKGIPGSIYNSGIKTVDLLTEARKTFTGHMNPQDFFCGNMFALCIDLRSTFAPDEYGNGRNRSGPDANITLEIHRSPDLLPDEPEDLRCHVYTVYDCILNLSSKGLISLVV